MSKLSRNVIIFINYLWNKKAVKQLDRKVQTDMRVIELSKLQQLTEACVLQWFRLSVGDSSRNDHDRKFTVTVREYRSLM